MFFEARCSRAGPMDSRKEGSNSEDVSLPSILAPPRVVMLYSDNQSPTMNWTSSFDASSANPNRLSVTDPDADAILSFGSAMEPIFDVAWLGVAVELS